MSDLISFKKKNVFDLKRKQCGTNTIWQKKNFTSHAHNSMLMVKKLMVAGYDLIDDCI